MKFSSSVGFDVSSAFARRLPMLCPSSTTHNASRLDAVSSYCRGYPVGGTLAISSLCYLRNFSSHALGSEETEVTSEVQEANDR